MTELEKELLAMLEELVNGATLPLPMVKYSDLIYKAHALIQKVKEVSK